MILGFPGPVGNYALRAGVRRMLDDKVVAAIAIDPACTDQTCAGCGAIGAANRTAQATFKCVACSHADNVAANIWRRGPAQLRGEGRLAVTFRYKLQSVAQYRSR